MIVIIGGGPAGRLGAIRLAQAGKEVLLVEKKKIGGQCLHHGCMVVCALNDVARGIHAWQTWRDLGVAEGTPSISYPSLIREMHAIQERIESVLDQETRNAGVEIRYGSEGRWEEGTLYVDDEPVQVEAGILATGSRPAIPRIPGVGEEQVVTPHTLGQLQDLPSRLAIIGGGVIAAEFSYIFSTFGSEVTVLSRSEFLKNLDPVLQKAARKALQGVVLRENTPVQEIQKMGTGLSLLLEGEEVLEVDAVLLATGLVPNSECAVGLRKGALGEIVVDDRMRTSAPGIYACGDVTGPPYLTPVARMEGMVAADNILGRDRRVDYRFLPQSITLEYDLLFCGGEGGQLAAVASPSPSGHESFWSVPSGNTGVSRVLMERESGRLSGVEIAAPGASLLGAYLAFLMRQGCTVQDLEGILEVHPSTDGIIPLLRYMAEWKRRQQSE